MNYIIKKNTEDTYVLLDANNNKLLSRSAIKIDTSLIYSTSTLITPDKFPVATVSQYKIFLLEFDWTDAPDY